MDAVIKARPSAYNFINPRSVKRREGFNPRFDMGEIAELAKSIRHQAVDCKVPGGLLNAIRVKKIDEASFELIDGDRRLTAVELLISRADAGDPEGYSFPDGIPAVSVAPNQDEVTSLIQMFEANTGKPFLPMEEAAAYKRMKDAGMTIEQIAKSVQRAHLHVVKTLALLDADPELQAAVVSGEVGGTIAKNIAVVARGDKKKQKELVAEVKAAGKDKKKKRAVVAKIEQARVDKAAKQGRTVKMRALTDDQLSEHGAKLSKHLTVLLKESGLPAEITIEDLQQKVEKDPALAWAFTFGAIQALKVAAGQKHRLEL